MRKSLLSACPPLLFLCCLSHGSQASVDVQCTRRCTMDDKTDECWDQAVMFYTQQVYHSLRDYSALLAHMNRWREGSEHVLPSTASRLEQTSIDTVLSNSTEDERAPLELEDFKKIFELLLNKTQGHLDQYKDQSVIPPSVVCPETCDQYPAIWANLCYVLIACLLLATLAFFLHTCYSAKKFDRLKS